MNLLGGDKTKNTNTKMYVKKSKMGQTVSVNTESFDNSIGLYWTISFMDENTPIARFRNKRLVSPIPFYNLSQFMGKLPW